MTVQQFLIYILAVGALFAMFSCYRAKTRVYCMFTRRDKTIARKWAKAKNGERIEFNGGWYYVNMKRIKLEALDKGFNLLFPTMVRCLEFTYSSIWPIDPETGEAGAETPESRKNLDKREDIEALNVGSQRAFGKQKMGMAGGWMPVAMLIGIVASLYFNYQAAGKIDMLGQAINVLQELAMKK